ncbi:unnamed protein product [Cuscuta europaea]|uniref:WPP domain-containing protein n=1 Tax=Cuscuta europaea TaxID=41803 RepID=A0A9P0YV76_CUSEU|nr:unnamed protein product [Cuscuta europaea]
MADNIEEQHQDKGAAASISTMSVTETPKAQEISSELPNKPLNFTFSIWPPTEKTRDAVINRLTETISAPSILSKRYGVIPQDEASEIAKRIEEEAFNAAAESAGSLDGDDGLEILQVYSKEVSKRMLDTVKSRSATPPVPESKPSESDDKLDAPPANSDEIPVAETES